MTFAILTDFVGTAGSNTGLNGIPLDGSVMTAGQIDDAFRELLAQFSRFYDDLGGLNAVAGTPTAVTVTASQPWMAYGTGDGQIGNGTILALKMGSSQGPATGAATLNVNTIGAKKIRRQGDTAIQANDWLSGSIVLLRYDTAYDGAAGAWALLNADPDGVATAATAADVWAGTATGKYISPSIAAAALNDVSLSDGATVMIDFTLGINFNLPSIGGNRTFAAASIPSAIVGRSGVIKVNQDGTGSGTGDFTGAPWTNYNSQNIVLSTAASSKDEIYYRIRSTSDVVLSLGRAIG